MAPRFPRSAIFLCFAQTALLSLLGWLAWQQWTIKPDISPNAQSATTSLLDLSDPNGKLVILRPKPLSAFSQTTRRPLFIETRRPPVVKPVKAKVRKPQAPRHIPLNQLKITGIISQGNARRAFIKSPNHPQGTWLGVNDVVGGWKLIKINRDFVRIASGDRQQNLEIYTDNRHINRN